MGLIIECIKISILRVLVIVMDARRRKPVSSCQGDSVVINDSGSRSKRRCRNCYHHILLFYNYVSICLFFR